MSQGKIGADVGSQRNYKNFIYFSSILREKCDNLYRNESKLIILGRNCTTQVKMDTNLSPMGVLTEKRIFSIL